MLAPRTLFISHKTGPGPHEQLRDALLARLKPLHDAGEIRVRIDVWARSGERFWDDSTPHYIAEASAAVFLIDREALNSGWVASEMGRLRDRQVLDPTVILLPVLAPGMSRAEFEADERAKVAVLHTIKPILTDDRDPADVVAEICERIDLTTWLTRSADPELEAWITYIEQHLPDETDGHFVIKALQELAGAAQPDLTLHAITSANRRRRLARALMGATEVGRLLCAVKAFKRALSNRDGQLCAALIPLWVPVELADRLREHVTRQDYGDGAGPEVLLSAGGRHTQDAYGAGFDCVRRAFRAHEDYWATRAGGQKQSSRWLPYLGTSATGFSDFKDWLDELIVDYVGDVEADRGSGRERMRELAAVLAKTSDVPAFVPLPTAYYHDLRHDDYPGLVFLVLRGFNDPVPENSNGKQPVALRPDLTSELVAEGRRYTNEIRHHLLGLDA